MYTVSNIIITKTMPESQHGLAGGVFNVLGGIGASIGIAIAAIVSNLTVDRQAQNIKVIPTLLMSGHRAAFWTRFEMCVAMIAVGALGLKNMGRIGKP